MKLWVQSPESLRGSPRPARSACRCRLPLVLLGVTALSNVFSLLYRSRDATTLSAQPAHPSAMARESFVSSSHQFATTRKMTEVRNRVTAFATVHSDCLGKERLLEILLSSSGRDVPPLSADLCRRLPRFERIVNAYGDGPVVVGLDTCSSYRLTSSGAKPMPRVAGMYHSGTNLVIRMMQNHFGPVSNETQDPDGSMYEVPWGKHVNPTYRMTNTIQAGNGVIKEHVLPVVIARSPFRWMRSMCREPYDAEFFVGESEMERLSCPTFVMNKEDEGPTNRVTVFADQMGFSKVEVFDSLIEMWATYVQAYVDATFPRLITRYEDWVLYPEQLLEIISQCSGAPLSARSFERVSDEARPWGPRRPVDAQVESLQKLGELDTLFETRTPEDQAYITEHLDVKLLETLGYQHILPKATARVI